MQSYILGWKTIPSRFTNFLMKIFEARPKFTVLWSSNIGWLGILPHQNLLALCKHNLWTSQSMRDEYCYFRSISSLHEEINFWPTLPTSWTINASYFPIRYFCLSQFIVLIVVWSWRTLAKQGFYITPTGVTSCCKRRCKNHY